MNGYLPHGIVEDFPMLLISIAGSVISAPLHPISTSDFLTIKFALEVRCDPQFSALPKAIHSSGEMRSKLR